MQLPFPTNDLFEIDEQGFAILTANNLPKETYVFNLKNPKKTKTERLNFIFDEIGNASSRSQGLSTTITNYTRFIHSNHKIFIKFDKDCIIGYIKIGVKNLMHYDRLAKLRELSPPCVLDFFVFENMQRHGFGKVLFEKMLQIEKLEPFQLAIDRPSPKFLGFLRKHYGLFNFRSQTNNFVIFDEFFMTDKEIAQKIIQQNKTTVKQDDNGNFQANLDSQFGKLDLQIKSGHQKTFQLEG